MAILRGWVDWRDLENWSRSCGGPKEGAAVGGEVGVAMRVGWMLG